MTSNRLDLPELKASLESFLAGEVSKGDLRARIADRVMTVSPLDVEVSTATPSQTLSFKIAEMLCGPGLLGEDFAILVQRILECVLQIEDPDEALDLLPLILHNDEFAALVAKHRRGLISELGLRSIIRKRFPFDRYRATLETAPAASLEEMGLFVERDDYRGLRHHLMLLGG